MAPSMEKDISSVEVKARLLENVSESLKASETPAATPEPITVSEPYVSGPRSWNCVSPVRWLLSIWQNNVVPDGMQRGVTVVRASAKGEDKGVVITRIVINKRLNMMINNDDEEEIICFKSCVCVYYSSKFE